MKNEQSVINAILMKRLQGTAESLQWLKRYIENEKAETEGKNYGTNFDQRIHSPLTKNHCMFMAYINEAKLRNVWKLEGKNTLFNFRLMKSAAGEPSNIFKRTGMFISTKLVPLETFTEVRVQQVNKNSLEADKKSFFIRILSTPENKFAISNVKDPQIFPNFISQFSSFTSDVAMNNELLENY